MVFFRPLHISDGLGDFPECHFGNVACGDADGVDGRRGVEIHDVPKVLPLKIFRRIQTAAGKQHESDAVRRKPLIDDLHIEIVKLFQEAALGAGL
ncbi:MAG: hypothetical protein NC548_32725 [Lachnospiraceae bacterium]|nr:hypothetical protein [Lachnospiraceae bacterium]MCM1231798.1 hypothetical protein [Ruminococcus flavefaciens]